MKKTLLALILLITIAAGSYGRTVSGGANLDFDLLTFESADLSSNTFAFQHVIVNYCTFTVKISDLRIVGYVRETDITASGWANNTSSNQAIVYNTSDSYVRNASGSWTLDYSDGSEQNCGTSGGITHYAKTTFTARYNGSENLEGGGYYVKPSGSGNALYIARRSDWGNLTKTDDYSSPQDSDLGGYPTGKEATQWKYVRLQFTTDGGTTWIDICESTDTSGTTDTNSGVKPCSGAICSGGNTATITPTITKTNTPVITATNTQTITQTFTITPTHTITPTYTITPTITQTHTPVPITTRIIAPPPAYKTPIVYKTPIAYKTPIRYPYQ
jgi:hypothetical protein